MARILEPPTFSILMEAGPFFEESFITPTKPLNYFGGRIYKNLYNGEMNMKPLKFVGSSLDDLRNFPKDEPERYRIGSPKIQKNWRLAYG